MAKGHSIVEAIDGLDGVAKLMENSEVQIIIADINMPKMNGIEMVLNMRLDPKNQNVKIFMLTAESSPETKMKLKAAGITAWILKPYDIDRLLNAIDKVLAK